MLQQEGRVHIGLWNLAVCADVLCFSKRPSEAGAVEHFDVLIVGRVEFRARFEPDAFCCCAMPCRNPKFRKRCWLG
jgi:hypothetical protein